MIQSQITGQLVSQVQVQIAWADPSGSWDSNALSSTNFVVVPRRGETVFSVKQQKYFNVIDVIHWIATPNPPIVVIVVQARA